MHKRNLASSAQTNNHILFGCPYTHFQIHTIWKCFLVHSHNMHLPDSRKARMRRAQRKLLLMVVEPNQHRLSLPPVSCFVLWVFFIVLLYWLHTRPRYLSVLPSANLNEPLLLLLSFFSFAFIANSVRSDVSKKEMMLERGSFHQAYLSTRNGCHLKFNSIKQVVYYMIF